MLKVGFICLLILAVQAQQKIASNAQTLRASDPWAWTKDKWEGDSRLYREVRDEIDKGIAKGQITDTVINQYKTTATQLPSNLRYRVVPSNWPNPLAYFRWGYAAFKAAQAATSYNDKLRKLSGLSWHLPNIPVKNYEFARLRFMVEARQWPDTRATPFPPQLKNAGRRLLKRNPNDYDVKYFFIRTIISSKSPIDRQQSLQYAHDLVRSRPEQAKSHAVLGYVYSRRWERTKSRQDGNRVIAAYSKFLQLASPDDETRQAKFEVIKEIKKALRAS